jgi:hypothetical protein
MAACHPGLVKPMGADSLTLLLHPSLAGVSANGVRPPAHMLPGAQAPLRHHGRRLHGD